MKNKKIFSKKYILILTALIILAIIGFIFINVHINNNNLHKYINENNFTIDKYNSYTLVKKEENVSTTYQLLLEKAFITKTIITEDNDSVLKIGLTYNMNKTIDIEMEYSGLNNNNHYAIQAQTAQFKNNEFTNCKTILSNNFNSKCDLMKENAQNFSTEVENILSEYKINLNYLKLNIVKPK